MKSLADTQDTFQRAILTGDESVLAEIVDTSKESRQVLFGVYRDAYALRLVDVLADDYEMLRAHVGAAAFDILARTYILNTPSRTANARWYGAGLPGFLSRHSPYREQPELAELAALEQALGDVFDAADASPLTLDALTPLAPDDWPNLVFAPHPAVRRLNFRTNAARVWSALKNGNPIPKPKALNETDQILVYRQGGQAKFRVMPSDEAMMWDEAAKGVRFSVLCEMMGMFAGEDEAPARTAAYLRGWIETGVMTGTNP